MKIKSKVGWHCHDCGKWYESKKAATQCCAEPTFAPRYYCPKCNQAYYTEGDAKMCCKGK